MAEETEDLISDSITLTRIQAEEMYRRWNADVKRGGQSLYLAEPKSLADTLFDYAEQVIQDMPGE